jgi:hypothetical protein
VSSSSFSFCFPFLFPILSRLWHSIACSSHVCGCVCVCVCSSAHRFAYSAPALHIHTLPSNPLALSLLFVSRYIDPSRPASVQLPVHPSSSSSASSISLDIISSSLYLNPHPNAQGLPTLPINIYISTRSSLLHLVFTSYLFTLHLGVITSNNY